MKPYEDFEKIYKEVTGHYNVADVELAKKIKEVEQVLKDEKETEVIAYFDEYKKSLALEYDFVTYDKTNIKVNLSSSLKSLKEQVKTFLDKIKNDINTINSMENADEIIFEFLKELDLAKAIAIVNERRKIIEQQKKIKEVVEEKQQEQEEVIKKVEEVQKELAPPIQLAPPVEEEKEYQLTFTVIGTKEKLRELKTFLENGGYKYE